MHIQCSAVPWPRYCHLNPFLELVWYFSCRREPVLSVKRLSELTSSPVSIVTIAVVLSVCNDLCVVVSVMFSTRPLLSERSCHREAYGRTIFNLLHYNYDAVQHLHAVKFVCQVCSSLCDCLHKERCSR